MDFLRSQLLWMHLCKLNISINTFWGVCCVAPTIFSIFWPSASNFKIFSWSLEHFFLKVGQNNFGNKIPFIVRDLKCLYLKRFYISFPIISCLTWTKSSALLHIFAIWEEILSRANYLCTYILCFGVLFEVDITLVYT